MATTIPSPFSVVASVLKDSDLNCKIDLSKLESLSDGKDVTMTEPFPGMDCFLLENVLSPAQCDMLLECTERSGYTFWDSRPDKRTDFRNAYTIEVPDKEMARYLWERIAPFLDKVPVEIGDDETDDRWQRDLEGIWDPYGTNELLLFARYTEGGHFSPHTDGFNVVDCDHRSMYSIVLYLNNCKSGGGTRFYANEQKSNLVTDENGRFTGSSEYVLGTITPKAGSCALFFHNIMHESVPVRDDSIKYIIRSDVMYTRRDPVLKTEQDREAFVMFQQAEELSSQGMQDEAMQLFRRAVKRSDALARLYGL